MHGDIIILQCVPQIMLIWGMVPDTWSATDRIFCPFGSFFALLPPPLPLTNWKIKILGKLRKITGDIIILHICNID